MKQTIRTTIAAIIAFALLVLYAALAYGQTALEIIEATTNRPASLPQPSARMASCA